MRVFSTNPISYICFEIGKFYEHTTGDVIAIIGEVNTTRLGPMFVAETAYGKLIPVGKTEQDAANYHEITKEKWRKKIWS